MHIINKISEINNLIFDDDFDSVIKSLCEPDAKTIVDNNLHYIKQDIINGNQSPLATMVSLYLPGALIKQLEMYNIKFETDNLMGGEYETFIVHPTKQCQDYTLNALVTNDLGLWNHNIDLLANICRGELTYLGRQLMAQRPEYFKKGFNHIIGTVLLKNNYTNPLTGDKTMVVEITAKRVPIGLPVIE